MGEGKREADEGGRKRGRERESSSSNTTIKCHDSI